MITKEQKIQEDMYEFPYHHIPNFEKGNFSVIRTNRGSHEYFGYISFIISQISKIPFTNLLDVGCGDGKMIHELYKNQPDQNYIGIDYSERAILFAKAMTPNCNFIHGNILDQNGKFDIVTLIETLEHIPLDEIDDFISALHKLTKSFLIITVPSKNVQVVPKHYQHFDLISLKKTLEPYFTITEHRYIVKKTIVTRILKSVLVNRFFALNHKATLNRIINSYMKNYFFGSSKNTKSIFVICKPKELSN